MEETLTVLIHNPPFSHGELEHATKWLLHLSPPKPKNYIKL